MPCDGAAPARTRFQATSRRMMEASGAFSLQPRPYNGVPKQHGRPQGLPTAESVT
jgi:hypothetical protein